MNKNHIKPILQKYLDNKCSAAEVALLFDYFKTSENLDELEMIVKDTLNSRLQLSGEMPDMELAFRKIQDTISLEVISTQESAKIITVKKPLFKYAAIAAILVLAIMVTAKFVIHKHGIALNNTAGITIPNDIEPGGNKAILQFANGKKIDLNGQHNGTLVNNGAVKIEKKANGQLVYSFKGGGGKTADLNTLSVPRGGQYQLTLADGTKVWLNSLSAITFPTSFNGTQRTVNLTGEAYFEVAHNKEKPFIVTSGKNSIKVLGTKFNITAYPDETLFKATLLQGSIAFATQQHSEILKPGDQALTSVSADDGKIGIRQVDPLREIAWKDGYFSFKEADPDEVMRELARWYDVNIKYEGKVPVSKITGRIKKQVKLSKVLEMLEFTGMTFKINGNTVIIES